MATAAQRLTDLQVKKATKPGVLHDGRGLYLNIGPGGSKSWLLRYQIDRKQRWMGLGPYPEIGLARAREKALEARRQKAEGLDPLAEREAQRAAVKAAAADARAKAITFRDCAEWYVSAHEAAWRNPKTAGQWTTTLTAYVYPVIGDLPVATIETAHATRILEPIWIEKTETASRVRGRIESILDFAKTHGWRAGENPARWKGHLANILPPPLKVRKVEHFAALGWREIGAFMAELGEQSGIAALALRFLILTAARTGEVRGATWREIDMRAAIWTVPAIRMKAGLEHRVPLSDDALAVLREAARFGADGFVFPGRRGGLSHMALLATLHRMGRDLTVHGFRSTFRDWCAETGKPSDIAEAALAHVQASKTVAAYQRGDLLDRRRRLMDQWADWCARPAGDVVDFLTPWRVTKT